MIFGIDFDNTIVSYEGVFHQIAVEKELIPESLPTSKDAVRNYLRNLKKEDDWTEMQGLVYGAKMDLAKPYPGVTRFFKFAKEAQIPVRIISHKTRFPFLGKQYDLHQAATNWLENHGFFDPAFIGMDRGDLFFESTIERKIKCIQTSGCTHFIDDLPELLLHSEFSSSIERWLFDPTESHSDQAGMQRFESWENIISTAVENQLTALG